jgi:hypothetical protein
MTRNTVRFRGAAGTWAYSFEELLEQANQLLAEGYHGGRIHFDQRTGLYFTSLAAPGYPWLPDGRG